MTTLDQIKARCTVDGECWIWQGALIDGRPYFCGHDGGVRFNRRVQKHVAELGGATVPAQTVVAQSCGNPLCCAPGHQEVQAPRTLAGLQQLMKQSPWASLIGSRA